MVRALDETVAEGPISASARDSIEARPAAAMRDSSSKLGPVTRETASMSAALPKKTTTAAQRTRRPLVARDGSLGEVTTGREANTRRAIPPQADGRRRTIAENFRRNVVHG